ncbi:MAG: hypothetical protein PVH61_02660 [Candidatus Aminicenantes bacterium]|jgi:hypothetical protein
MAPGKLFLNRLETGEVYRIIADRRGIFVQPALFEAFGLTILAAIISSLPGFGPIFGGPSEIIEYRLTNIYLAPFAVLILINYTLTGTVPALRTYISNKRYFFLILDLPETHFFCKL